MSKVSSGKEVVDLVIVRRNPGIGEDFQNLVFARRLWFSQKWRPPILRTEVFFVLKIGGFGVRQICIEERDFGGGFRRAKKSYGCRRLVVGAGDRRFEDSWCVLFTGEGVDADPVAGAEGLGFRTGVPGGESPERRRRRRFPATVLERNLAISVAESVD
ncbi:hypothetical protein U1Q18_032382 [Sarracenia purpurea var. burkii]